MMTGDRDYARSYYAATAHPTPDRPALNGTHEADVCVIGGGFSGLAAALILAERGRRVILLEANRVGWGASGRNGGQILPGWSGEAELIRQRGAPAEEFLRRTKYRGHAIIEDVIARYDIACDYARGAVAVSTNRKQQAALEADYRDAERRGEAHHLELLDRAALRSHVASDAYLGGLLDRKSAHCHPLNLCLGEARAAEQAGVRIYERSPARSIAHGERPVVAADSGTVAANFVIIAGNAHHRLERQRLAPYMLPAQTFMIATEPLGARAREALPTNLAVADANWVLDYFRRTPDDRILFGGRCAYSNRPIADIEAALAPRLARVLPQLSDARPAYAWSGAIGIPLNRIPLIGRLAENVFFLQGYSGHGVNCSHIAAEIVADAIDGRTADLSLFESVRRLKIPAADLIGNPLLALGMTWFRARDALGV
jgi:glycine/D-amino acid oxidase-like deaminating enzyme